jgi:hypothetical protein
MTEVPGLRSECPEMGLGSFGNSGVRGCEGWREGGERPHARRGERWTAESPGVRTKCPKMGLGSFGICGVGSRR